MNKGNRLGDIVYILDKYDSIRLGKIIEERITHKGVEFKVVFFDCDYEPAEILTKKVFDNIGELIADKINEMAKEYKELVKNFPEKSAIYNLEKYVNEKYKAAI